LADGTVLAIDGESTVVRGVVRYSPTLEVQFERMQPRVTTAGDLQGFARITDGQFAAFCERRSQCVVVEVDRQIDVGVLGSARKRITAIAATEDSVAIAGDDGRIRVVSPRGVEQFSIPIYRPCVRCCAASKRFGIVVAGTDDRRLIIADAVSGAAVRVVRLPVVPEMVVVTPGWGFLLVHGCEEINGEPRYSLLLYSLNGVQIRTVKFGGKIARWCAWASPAGFDFALCSSPDGRLYGFEVFWLDIGKSIYRCGDEVVGLEYSAAHGIAVAITRGGKLHFVPFLPRSIEKYA
jgi:hypothetical protein